MIIQSFLARKFFGAKNQIFDKEDKADNDADEDHEEEEGEEDKEVDEEDQEDGAWVAVRTFRRREAVRAWRTGQGRPNLGGKYKLRRTVARTLATQHRRTCTSTSWNGANYCP